MKNMKMKNYVKKNIANRCKISNSKILYIQKNEIENEYKKCQKLESEIPFFILEIR